MVLMQGVSEPCDAQHTPLPLAPKYEIQADNTTVQAETEQLPEKGQLISPDRHHIIS